MKKRTHWIYITIFALLFTLYPAPQRVLAQDSGYALMSTTKFDSKTAKKNISITYRKVPNGIIAICKNKNSFPVKLQETIDFLDAAGTVMDSEKDINVCLGAKKTCVLFFKAPLTDTGDYKFYHAYKKTIKVSKTTAKDYSNKIITSSNLQPTVFNLSVSNNSGKKLDIIRISCIFYDASGKISGCTQKYVTCNEAGSSVLDTISYPSICSNPSKVKVYVDAAYKL